MLPSWGFQSYVREVSLNTSSHGGTSRDWCFSRLWHEVLILRLDRCSKTCLLKDIRQGNLSLAQKTPKKHTQRTPVWAHSDSNVLCLESFNHDSAPANLGQILAFYKQNTAHMTLLIQKILIYSSCAIEPYTKQRWFYHTLMLNAPFCKWFWSGFWVPKHLASQGIWSTRDR